ncbi:hypothetical protein XPR_2243 [Xanthomonas arboricola pv. pruni MAFF 301420]|uniref:Transferrin receptor-like dimerisation domain-containing protein n=1 Tax=Xanthomonas arboricola pv. pruni MAFF 301420 TaxID=1418095 RepID=W4SHI1_9XANT|nr:hypothetical protein XPR_2243 [Xanthomonas arboricola pv. pruni MAFF 301420]
MRGTLNASLQRIDQTLLAEGGLPGRPWYRNLIYAPGLATGYEVKTLPGIREALEDRRWEDLSATSCRPPRCWIGIARRSIAIRR